MPYSPRQTCGATDCHDYDLITEGFHFTQGKGEAPTATQQERLAWATSPGNYGGSWCSPAPLYRYLSPKDNESARTIDMTSYTFLTAGCGDCHPAGSSAADARLRGKEVHQFAKGDDPGGFVRGDLDDSVRACDDCHATGDLGAPIARHAWLPPLHLDELACQTCHIPERAVKAALVQASDVFNPGARIPTKGKHLWTFYGPDGAWWNHYGELELMGYDDKPTDPYRPEYARYKGKIFPVNRIHSAWLGIEIEGQPALMQPRMGDIYKMWDAHQKDPGRYPRLAEIVDDGGDGVPEINRPAEIEALIASVTEVLRAISYPMDGKRVVWVSDDRVYASGTEYRTVDAEPWEASPFANVHKYSHDVYPARAALGAGGCTDCYAHNAGFFDRPILERAFGEDGRPVWTSGAGLLGFSEAQVRLGAFREACLKPAIYGLLALAISLAAGLGVRSWTTGVMGWIATWGRRAGVLFVLAVVGMGAIVCSSPGLAEYAALSHFTLDALHFPVAAVVLLLGALSSTAPDDRRTGVSLRWVGFAVIAATSACGGLMLVKVEALASLVRFAYTGFDIGLVALLVVTVVQLALRLLGGTRKRS
ncbi:MAG: hypothetical protein JXB39_16385 [Deltaproteobacteria bacterium]|nr:hypothetical protein [Deltaproteobacteria bacterium]